MHSRIGYKCWVIGSISLEMLLQRENFFSIQLKKSLAIGADECNHTKAMSKGTL